MRRSPARLLLSISTVLAVITVHRPALAMIAVDVLRVPLRAASHTAAACPDIREGRYLVHLRIDGQGRGHDATLNAMPENVSPATERCVLDAFEGQSYGAIANDRVGGIQVSFPFVVTSPAPPT
ncbi:MAG: hypothetical protein J0L92_03175 [Deltaproteobacteria bacterium]|nr:hypothetical protein [Deltaproteobacteria bacterium]